MAQSRWWPIVVKECAIWGCPELSLPISLKPVGGIASHLGQKVILGSSIVSQTLTLGWPRVTLNLGGGASAGKPFSFELNFVGEKLGNC